MMYGIDFDINTFEFWGGADISALTPEEKTILGSYIEDYFDDMDVVPTETDINDLVWFGGLVIVHTCHGLPQCGVDIFISHEDDVAYDDDLQDEIANGYATIKTI